MRILFIHNRYQYAGGEDTAVELDLQLLRDNGHEVALLGFDNDQIHGGIAKMRAGAKAFYNGASAKMVAAKVAEFKPDIVHVHNVFFQASPSVLFAAQKAGIPVVMTLHNYRLICANALLLRDGKPCELCVPHRFPSSGIRYKCYRGSALESALVIGVTGVHKQLNSWNEQVDQFIVLTAFARDKFQHSSLNPDPEKMRILPNYVPDSGLSRGAAERSGDFLYVGRLSGEKGVNSLVEAFLQTPAQNLVIAGDGPQAADLQARTRNASNIRFIGKQTKAQVMQLMGEAKALIFPSVCYEGLPFTIVEAFSKGTPVIASRLGGMAEMVKDGVNGFHFTAGDAEDMMRAIEKFELSPNRTELYNEARKSYLNEYNASKHYTDLIGLYMETIRKKGSGA